MGASVGCLWERVDELGVQYCLLLWDPLALYVCPSWIHGQCTKEAILLNNDNDTVTINSVTPRRQDTAEQPAVGAVKE